MITFDWTVDSLAVAPEQNGKENVVILVLFCVSAKEGEFVATVSDAVRLSYSEGDFTPYNLLKENQIIEWVKTVLGEKGVKAIEDNLENQIKGRQNPQTVFTALPLPWSQ
jgi:hypothetical protein